MTRWLGQTRLDDAALAELVSAVQTDLRELAARHLRAERPDHTLQPTALVNEAYLRLVQQRDRNWENKRHFLSIASTAMRRVLLEHARNRVAAKRGGGAFKVTLFDAASVLQESPEVTIALDEALTEFADLDPRNAQIVELRWFVGLDVEETAAALEVSTRTVERGWRAAAAWLRARLTED
ncbi:MAG: ECF-type sigma factor [bacterium]|nr:ECF-type sigma factor [bacterium]